MSTQAPRVRGLFAFKHSFVIRERIRNFLIREGFFSRSETNFSNSSDSMLSQATTRRSSHPRSLSMPHDYIRRRRVFRLISNVILITVLSLVAGYVITRQTGGTAFSLPKRSSSQPVSAPLPAALPLQPTDSSLSSVAPPPSSLRTNFSDGYHLSPGSFPVTEIGNFVLHDSTRNKDLHLRIFYPDSPGKFPVIIFSHGAGGSQNCCESLTKHWATYGYITIQPTHDDSLAQRRQGGEDTMPPLQAVRDVLKNSAYWQSRPLDISFVLDSLPDLQKRIPALAEKIDATRIGVGGHSMGAYTSEAIAGASIDLPNHPATNFSDHRVKAALALSPQGPHQFGLTDQSFQTISIPFLGVTGSLDSLGPVASPAWHKIPFDRSQPGDKYHLFITGAAHSSFVSPEAPARLVARGAQLPPSSQAQAIFDYTNSASLAFWDAYLKNDATAKQYLQSDTLTDASHGAAQLSRR